MVRFEFGHNKLKYYAGVGLYPGILLNAKTKSSGTSNLYYDKDKTQPVYVGAQTPLPPQSLEATTDIRDEINPLNIGVTGGAGIRYPFGRHSILLDARFTLGLSNIQQHTDKNGKNNTGCLMVDIGYGFSIFK